jgi:hypothetical protein
LKTEEIQRHENVKAERDRQADKEDQADRC